MALLSEIEIARELAPFEISLPPERLAQLSCYLELLVRWNRRVNLTGLREPRHIVRRLFGESLYLSHLIELRGWLVDIGSGAGFPGLALKLLAPELKVTLVETRQKKCAFLKAVARACGFSHIEVVTERFEDWARTCGSAGKVDVITTRAVAVSEELLELSANLLRAGGILVSFTQADGAHRVAKLASGFSWLPARLMPGTKSSVVLVGRNRIV